MFSMRRRLDLPGAEFISDQVGSSHYTLVPLGFSEWVRTIDSSLPSIAPHIEQLLRENNVYLALECYELLGDDFTDWMKILRNGNRAVFEAINELLAREKFDQALTNYWAYTLGSIGRTYH